VLNFRARSIQQSAKVGQYAASNPYSAQGLLGDNQIVAVADTGLDVNSCYFSDSNGQHVDYSTIGNPVYSTSFRKVIQYVAAGDRRDDVGGHGTHATATVVGSIQNGDYARSK
jgi:subtilisin family serine protease